MADETNGPVEAAPYRVLARKYRPQSFDDLIGQEPVVRTLTNAFEAGRIAQAWMLTGVRGVGKTTTARILARALNYETDAVHRPTIHMREEGVHDRAIMEGRHVDVVEMDAASHTGIDDIREIIAQVRYKPVSARYKVYIIDEVHMLSTQAFNGLLKTLEEPPEHVKFVFATTEIRKVPVTVLSRCQRFDLRRVEAGLLIRQLEKVLAAEAVEAEAEALRILARAAEGSVRDALSLTDQAIAHGGGRVTAEAVRDMLGLADRVRIIDLFEQLMRGDARTALRELGEQYASGADPVVILSDLADFTHLVTTLRYVPEAAEDVSLTPAEATRGRAFAASLSVRTLSQVWQMLLKAVEEARNATSPRQSAEMALIRIAHAADLPAPDDLLRLLQAGCDLPAPGASPVNGGAAPGFASADSREPIARNAASPASGSARGFQPLMAASAPQPATLRPPAPAPEPEDGPRSLRDIEALAGEKRDSRMRVWIRRYLRPVRMEPGRLEVALAGEAPVTLAGDLGRRLHEWTGRRWVVTLASEGGGPTIEEEETARREALLAEAAEDPDVAAVLDAFPGAVIREVRLRAETDAAAEEIEAESAPETASLAETLAPDDVVEFDTGDDLEPVGEPDPGLDDDDDDDEL